MKAILTGHSRGLGAGIAADLLARGISVLGLSRLRNEELGLRYSAALEQHQLDLADVTQVVRWIDGGTLRAYLAGCRTALLINNAGVVQPLGPLHEQDTLSIARAVALNVGTPLMLASAVAAASRDAPACRILHISSGAGSSTLPGSSIYCATKAALDHHARTAALDPIPGMRICSLAPGVIDTDMQAEIRVTALDRFPLREQFEALKRNGVLMRPEECARQVVDFLLSEQFGKAPVAALPG